MQLIVVPAAIASGQSLSDAIDLGGGRLVGIDMPAAWTAANLTFQSSFNGDVQQIAATWNNVYDDLGVEVVVQAAASRAIRLGNPGLFLGQRWIKIRSGTGAAPVNQAGVRALQLILVP